MDDAIVAKLGRELYEAEQDRQVRSPLSDEFAELDVKGAYAVQEAYARLRRDAGATLVGRKIGCTSKAIQDLFGIDTPDFGQLFDDMCVEDGGAIPAGELIQPMVEPEIAFLLGSSLQGPGVTREDVEAATEAVVPCLEIIDSRIEDWRIAFVDTVADNGSSARYVIGSPERAIDGLDLASVAVSFRHNGRVVGEATGAAVLGHPADSVAWLANALAAFGRGLGAGEYVLSGSMTTAARAAQGDDFEAHFGEFGVVRCRFV
jgi:2-keto-4-pentenoate hydratase